MPVITFYHYWRKDEVIYKLDDVIKKFKIINNITNSESKKKSYYSGMWKKRFYDKETKYTIHLNDNINNKEFLDIIKNINRLFDDSGDYIIFYYKTGKESREKYTFSNYTTVKHKLYLDYIEDREEEIEENEFNTNYLPSFIQNYSQFV